MPQQDVFADLKGQGDEIEAVDALPLVKAGIDFYGVPVEQSGVGQLSFSGAHFALLLEEIVG